MRLRGRAVNREALARPSDRPHTTNYSSTPTRLQHAIAVRTTPLPPAKAGTRIQSRVGKKAKLTRARAASELVVNGNYKACRNYWRSRDSNIGTLIGTSSFVLRVGQHAALKPRTSRHTPPRVTAVPRRVRRLAANTSCEYGRKDLVQYLTWRVAVPRHACMATRRQ